MISSVSGNLCKNPLPFMIKTVRCTGQRSICMLSSGCQGSFNELKVLPEVFCRVVGGLSTDVPNMLKQLPYALIALIPLCLYDQEFGYNLVIDPIKKVCWLISDPIHVLPIAFKYLVLITAVSVASLATGIILGMAFAAVVKGSYGFANGVVLGYAKPLETPKVF